MACARIAGIMGAKQTHALIPMCHPLPIDQVRVDIQPQGREQLCIQAEVRCTYHTGVEMEALTGVSTALLTIYDMAKALDRAMTITNVRLMRKEGGKSGVFTREG